MPKRMPRTSAWRKEQIKHMKVEVTLVCGILPNPEETLHYLTLKSNQTASRAQKHIIIKKVM